MKIERIDKQKIPFDLLLLADEDEKQIRKYLDTAVFFTAVEHDEIRGVIGLNKISDEQIEIVNVAVYEKYQNQKIGTELVEKAVGYSKENNFKEVIIKTGACGIMQLYVYQRCGFRFVSVNKDYFLKHYKKPLFENGIQCRDQVVLSYKIYSIDKIERIVNDYWKRFTEKCPEYTDRDYEVWNFCYGEYLPNKLLALVREGRKTGTSSAIELYGKEEKVPEEGDISVITSGNGLPGCIIQTKEIRKMKFKEITAEEAELEGEGDLSLEFWRNAHRWFFTLEYEEAGREFTEDIPVLFERFEVIYDEDDADKH